MLTHLDLWNVWVAISMAYKDEKEDVDDVTTLLKFCEQFSHNVSLRRANQRDSVKHCSHVGLTNLYRNSRLIVTFSSLYMIQLDL